MIAPTFADQLDRTAACATQLHGHLVALAAASAAPMPTLSEIELAREQLKLLAESLEGMRDSTHMISEGIADQGNCPTIDQSGTGAPHGVACPICGQHTTRLFDGRCGRCAENKR